MNTDIVNPNEIGVVAPTPLPWDDADRLDRDALGRNVERWGATSLSGFIIGSAGGEETYISESELFDAVEVIREARRPGALLIGGIDSPSTTETTRRIE